MINVRVRYTDKAGNPQSQIMPRDIAEKYIKTVRGGAIEDLDVAISTNVDVKKCPDGTVEAQRAATKAFYAPINEARKGKIVSEETDTETSEGYAERMSEHFADARAAGQSSEDAWDDWNYINRR